MPAVRADEGDGLHAEVASVLDWWGLAGVDLAVGDASRDWLRPAPRSTAMVAEAPPPPAPATLPDTLDAFLAWLATSGDADLLGPPAARLAPAGDAAAGLMVLVDMPEAGDAVAGRLLAGEAGVMLDRMMRVPELGLTRDAVWLAPLFPARPARGRAEPGRLPALAEIARHHIALKKPEKLLMMGEDVARALLGPGLHRGRFRRIETAAGPVAAVASFSPHVLQANPSLKKAAYEDLKLLAKGEDA